MNRRNCNVFGSLNGLFCGLFILIAIYTWMWADDAAGMTFICKYFLLSISVRVSPDLIREKAYNSTVKYWLDIGLSWLFPAQCVVVLVDCILCLCCKPKPREVTLRVKTDS